MSEEKGRRLKVLVIHDTHFNEESEEEILATSDLALASLTFGTGRVSNVLHNWVEVVRVISGLNGGDPELSASVEIPDLMLVDCHFTDDSTSPKLRVADKQRVIDPRGLLYGSVLASYFVGTRPLRPFAFVPYSQNMGLAAKDPYAQTFYSLLSAMFEDIPEIVEPAYYSRAMAATGASATPESVVATALEHYRLCLLRFLETCEPEWETFQHALAAVSAYLAGGASLPEDLAVGWTDSKGCKDRVLLRSLFADCRRAQTWIKDERQRQDVEDARGSVKGRGVMEFLEKVLEGRNYCTQVLEPVRGILRDRPATLRGILRDRPSTSQDPRWGKGSLMAERRILAFTIAWAMDRSEQKLKRRTAHGPGSLEDQIGLTAKQINRALGSCLNGASGGDFQGQEFLQRLDGAESWPFEPLGWLRTQVVRYLEEEHRSSPGTNPHLAPKYWPRCLQ